MSLFGDSFLTLRESEEVVEKVAVCGSVKREVVESSECVDAQFTVASQR